MADEKRLRGRDCNVSNQMVQAKRVITGKMAEGQKSVKARLAAKGYQDTDIRGGVADTPGCVCLRPSCPQVISLCPVKTWGL